VNHSDREGGERRFAALLASRRDDLLRIVRAEGRRLVERESAEDLVQGIYLRAIEVEDRFVYRGDAQFLGWLRSIARQHIADRHRYWRALRRNAQQLLRISAATRAGGSAVDPSASGTGPFTRAAHGDDVALVMQIFPQLFPRDRALLEAVAEGLSNTELAQRFGLAEEAARKARLRALSRFRLAWEAVARRPAQ
jgi:RNA polymerase sigma factor (sigma-70 family)